MRNFWVFISMLLIVASCGTSPEEQATHTATSTFEAWTETPTPTLTITPTITRTPGPTPIPCPEEGIPLTYGKINIYFFEVGRVPSTCNVFGSYIAKADQWAKTIGETIHADVYIYNSAETAAEADYTWGRKTGCNNYTSNSLPEILDGWKRGGALAYPPYKEGVSPFTEYPTRIILNAAWRESSQQVASSVVHELIHAIQNQYYGGRNPCSGTLPSWWTEGQAMFYGYGVTETWGMPYFELDLSECAAIQLSELPQLTNNCVYGMGREALSLLAYVYGDRSFDLWREFEQGATFEIAFKNTYGTSINEFSDLFETYKLCLINQGFGNEGYLKCLPSPASTATP